LTERGAWLYTAITRAEAEAEIHLVGTEDGFKIITETMSYSHKRKSYLAELLMCVIHRHHFNIMGVYE